MGQIKTYGDRNDRTQEMVDYWQQTDEEWYAYKEAKKTEMLNNFEKIIPYIVKKGDTLESIAGKFHTTAEIILSLNPKLKSKKKLKPGKEILVPLFVSDFTYKFESPEQKETNLIVEFLRNRVSPLDKVSDKKERKRGAKKDYDKFEENKENNGEIDNTVTDNIEPTVSVVPDNTNEIIISEENNSSEIIDNNTGTNNEIVNVTEKPVEDPDYGKDVRWKTKLTEDQKIKYHWDLALQEFGKVNQGIGTTTLEQWTRKAISKGWKPGDPVPDIHEIKVYDEDNIRYIVAYSYNEAYGRAVKDNYKGYWYWITPIGENKGSKVQQVGSVTKYNNAHHTFSEGLINQLYWVSNNETLYTEAIQSGVLGKEFIRLVKDVQEKLFTPEEKNVTGMLDDETMRRVAEKVDALGIEKKEKKFVKVGSNYFVRVFNENGVNFRRTPHTEVDIGYPSGGNLIFPDRIPYGTLLKVISQTPDINEKEGWYYVELEDSSHKGYVAKDYVRKTPQEDPKARLYKVKEGDQALALSYKMFTGPHHSWYIRYMVEMNKGEGIQIEGDVQTDNPNFYKHVKLWKGYNIWVPSEAYALGKSTGKIEDIYDLLDQQDELLAVGEYVTTAQAEAAQAKFVEYLNIIRQFSQDDLDKYTDQTGINWTDIVSAVSGPITFGLNYLRQRSNWLDLNKSFEREYGITADDVTNTLLYFRQLAVADTLKLLNQSQDFAEEELTRLKDPTYAKELYTVITSYKKDYLEADKLRAQAIFKYFDNAKKESSSTVEILKIIGYSVLYSNYDLSSLYEEFYRFYLSGDKLGLAKSLAKKDANTASNFITIFEYTDEFMESIALQTTGTLANQMVVHVNVLKKYPELVEAMEMDEITMQKRFEKKDEFRILTDPNLPWRDMANYDSQYMVTTVIQTHLHEVIDNVKSTKQEILQDYDLVWELEPVLQYTMAMQGILPESKFGQIILDKYADVEFENTIISIGLAVVGIGLAIAGFFTGGATWAGLALIGGSIVVSGIDLYREIKTYQFHSAASHTGVADIESVSSKDPSIWGIVFALLGLGLDVVDIFKPIIKALKMIDDVGEVATFKDVYKILKEANDPSVAKLSESEFVNAMINARKEGKRLETFNQAVNKLLKESGMEEIPSQMTFAYSRMYELNPSFAEGLIKSFNGNPAMLMKYATVAIEKPHVLESLAKLGESIATKGDVTTYKRFAEVFTYLASEGKHTMDILPTIMGRITQSGIKDPDLITEIITSRVVQDVLMGEDPSILPKLWEQWKTEKATSMFADEHFFRFLQKQNLPSINKTTEVLVTEVRITTQQSLTKSMDALKELRVNGVLEITANSKAMAAVEDVLINAFKNGNKIDAGPKALRDFLETQMNIVVKEIDPKVYETLLSNVFAKDPDLFIRNFILKDVVAVNSNTSKLVKSICESGEASFETLQRIFSKVGDQSVEEVAVQVNKLITEKPQGWQKQMDEMGNGEKKIEVESQKDVNLEAKNDRTLDELAPNGKIPINAEFNKWFDDLTKGELESIWNNDKLRKQLEVEIRKPGGLHEWFMVAEVRKFKDWGIKMEDIKNFRTKTTELTGTNPITGEPFAHSILNSEGKIVSGPGSKSFHNELQGMINSVDSLNEFNLELAKLIERWQIDPNLLPPFIAK